MKQGDIIELEIEHLAFGGRGVGKATEGNRYTSVFVPFTAPGDRIKTEITSVEGLKAEGNLVEVLKPSEHRVEAPCPYFATCGGCDWQNVSYEEQVKQKQKMISHLLKDWADKILPVIPSPKQYQYRHRGNFKGFVKSSTPTIGLFKMESHEVVDIKECHVVYPQINEFITRLREFLSKSRPPNFKFSFDVYVSDNGKVDAAFYVPDELGKLFQKFRDQNLDILNDDEFMRYYIDDLEMLYYPSNFTQINLEQNYKMVKTVLDFANPSKNDNVLDLYCGIGNLSLPMALKTKRVVGIEGAELSVEAAKESAKHNNIKNADFFISDVNVYLKNNHDKKKFDIVMMDPPRDGIDRFANLIGRFGAKKIIYVSCNPRSLVTDLKIIERAGYKVQKMQPLDMFPQTFHIETVVLLTK
jgi:23S rRNA (uracil1939-C5)-methyltransferase